MSQVDTPEEMKDLKKWYGEAKKYWKDVPSSVDGMLGGFAHISSTDVKGSKQFIKEFIESVPQPRIRCRYALDCGAGIGRVTKNLLLPLFKKVDMVEQNPDFLDKAKEYLGSGKDRVGAFFGCGLQEFTPESARYDLIWCQWVLGHLTDDDLVKFFERCKSGLQKGGLICVKENICALNYVVDSEDSSVTRSCQTLHELFTKAGLKVIKEDIQNNFPKVLYKVKMYALSPL